MSDQPERKREASAQANAAAEPASAAPSLEAPLIRTDIRPAAGRKGRGTAQRQSTRKSVPAFDADAINRLVDMPSAESDASDTVSNFAPAEASLTLDEEPAAEAESPAVKTAKPVVEATERPLDAAPSEPVALPSEAELPVVKAGVRTGVSDKMLVSGRRAGKARHAKRRQSRPQASRWIVYGVCGASAVLVVVLLVNLLNRPAANRAVTPREAPQTPHRPDSDDRMFSRTGVRPMDAEEKVRRREQIDSFAKMAESEEKKLHREKLHREKLHREKPKPDDDRMFSRTGVTPMDAEEMARRRNQIDSFAEMAESEAEKLRREEPKAEPKADSPGKPK